MVRCHKVELWMTVEKGGDRLVAEMTVRGERREDLIAIG